MRTLFFCLLVLSAVCANAAPVAYQGVGISKNLIVTESSHSETEAFVEFETTLDLEAGQIEGGPLMLSVYTRRLLVTDPNPASQMILQVDNNLDAPCGAPPCLSSVDSVGRLLQLDSGTLVRATSVLAPDDAMYFSVAVDGFPLQERQSALVAANVSVRKPVSLVIADVVGSFPLFAQSSVLAIDGAATSELQVVDELNLEFGGDGTCSGGSTGLVEVNQLTLWPGVSSRASLDAKRDGTFAATNCSYTVDVDRGSVTVTLELEDEGEIDTIDFAFLISADYRYLVGGNAFVDVDGSETAYEQNFLLGVKRNASPENSQLSGIYLMSIIGEAFARSPGGGTDSDFAARYAIDFSGAPADGQGFSACTIVGSSRAGVRRELAGTIPVAGVTQFTYGTEVGPQFNQCRYRASSVGSALELSEDGSNWIAAVMHISDDTETLLLGSLTTSSDPMPLEVETALGGEISSLAWTGLAQRFNEPASSTAVAEFLTPFIPLEDPAITLASAVLPGSRSVAVGSTATAFATVINAGTQDAIRCRIAPALSIPAAFSYQQTDPSNNGLVGSPNALVDIAAGQGQSFVFSITPEQEVEQIELPLEFDCLNSGGAASVVGINTFLFSASAVVPADVVALAATQLNDGIVHLASDTGNGVMSMATINLGSSSDVSVTADTGDSVLPLSLALCQTDPLTSLCINPTMPTQKSVDLIIDNNATPTFGVFLSSTEPISLNPALNRVFLRIRDSGGVVRGSTSVAVQTD